MGDEARFGAILEGIVADEAPRLFAVVQEYGDRGDGRIAAWLLAFADHAEVIAVGGGLRMSLSAPESALRGFNIGSRIRARVWSGSTLTQRRTAPERSRGAIGLTFCAGRHPGDIRWALSWHCAPWLVCPENAE
ncbi:hypothetical protein [Saccharopolyspora sp. NPDC002686]|uniref:hypothetical protein n=1 Tax=Saccharopolyspora sp. NPDC002686 TaxID=3154541 RepID=UPI00331911A4